MEPFNLNCGVINLNKFQFGRKPQFIALLKWHSSTMFHSFPVVFFLLRCSIRLLLRKLCAYGLTLYAEGMIRIDKMWTSLSKSMLFGGNSDTATAISVRSRRILLLYRRYNQNNNHSNDANLWISLSNESASTIAPKHAWNSTELNEKRSENNNFHTNALKLSIRCECVCVCQSCLLRSSWVSVLFAVVNENRHRRHIHLCCTHTHI